MLGDADLTIDKVSYSAFAHTRLGWWLGKVGVDHVVLGGIVTNGGVASTARDAHGRDLGVTLLADGCGAFDPAVHDATLTSLRSSRRACDGGRRHRRLVRPMKAAGFGAEGRIDGGPEIVRENPARHGEIVGTLLTTTATGRGAGHRRCDRRQRRVGSHAARGTRGVAARRRPRRRGRS